MRVGFLLSLTEGKKFRTLSALPTTIFTTINSLLIDLESLIHSITTTLPTVSYYCSAFITNLCFFQFYDHIYSKTVTSINLHSQCY